VKFLIRYIPAIAFMLLDDLDFAANVFSPGEFLLKGRNSCSFPQAHTLLSIGR
jgi:hypothetical protein